MRDLRLQSGNDPRPVAGSGLDIEGAAEQLDPLAHRAQAKTTHQRRADAGWIEARSVVDHAEHRRPVALLELNANHAGPGMLADVGQGLLHDPEELPLCLWREGAA